MVADSVCILRVSLARRYTFRILPGTHAGYPACRPGGRCNFKIIAEDCAQPIGMGSFIFLLRPSGLNWV